MAIKIQFTAITVCKKIKVEYEGQKVFWHKIENQFGLREKRENALQTPPNEISLLIRPRCFASRGQRLISKWTLLKCPNQFVDKQT